MADCTAAYLCDASLACLKSLLPMNSSISLSLFSKLRLFLDKISPLQKKRVEFELLYDHVQLLVRDSEKQTSKRVRQEAHLFSFPFPLPPPRRRPPPPPV